MGSDQSQRGVDGLDDLVGGAAAVAAAIRATRRAHPGWGPPKTKAVTAQKANLDMQEKNWLNYIAGGLFAKVKKTKDKRYYLRP